MEHGYIFNRSHQPTTSPAPHRFWMVTGDKNSPKVRHGSYEDADKEANRLSQLYPETTFYVLQAVSGWTTPVGSVKVKF